MAITSTEVQNLIGAQMGLFGMSTTYGQQVSQNVGTGAPQQFAQFGAGAVMDPRAPQDLTLGAQFGMGVARAGVGAANVGVGALSMAGMFGFAPRAFDPFMGTLGAVGRGYRSGMAAGGMGAGIARGMGMGGMAMGGYMAAGSAMNWATNQVLQGAQEGLRINAMLSQQATRGNMPGMGGISQPHQAAGVTSMIRGMAGPGMGVGDLTNMMGAGMQGGMFRDVGNMQQFRARFSELKNSVQQIVQTLQVTQQEGMAVMQQMRSMGFGGVGQAGAAAAGIGGLAAGMSMDPRSLIGAAGSGAQMARRLGMGGAFGAQMAMGMAGRLGGGMFSDAALSEASGGLPAAMAGPALGGQFANAAMRFTSSRAGFQLMGALMDPATGQLDAGRVASFQMNEYSSKQIRNMYRKNIQKGGVRTALGARHGSLSQQLIGDLGPEGLIGGYAQSQLQGRKLGQGENMADVTSMMIQQATGLGEQQAGMIQQLITASPGMKQAAEQKIRDGLSEQKRQHQMQQMYSIEGIKRRIVDAYVEPIRAPLRNLGASITNWGQDVFGGAVDFMLGGARPGPSGSTKISPLGASMYQGGMMGGYAGGGGGGGGTGFSMGGQDFSMGGPSPIGGPAGLVGDYFGLQDQYNPRITMGLGAATLGGMAMRGPAGRLMASAPEAVIRGFGGDLMSRGGVRRAAGGLISGAFRGGGGMLGRALPWVAGAALAGDVGMNVLPQMGRDFGITPNYSGGITGDAAGAMQSIYQGGYLRDIAGFSTSGSSATAGSIPVNIGQSAMSTWRGQGGGVFQVQAAPLPGILKETFQASAAPSAFLTQQRDLSTDDMHKIQQTWAQERVHMIGEATNKGGGPVAYARNLTNIITNRAGVGGKIGANDFAGHLALLSAIAPDQAGDISEQAKLLLSGATSNTKDFRAKSRKAFAQGLYGGGSGGFVDTTKLSVEQEEELIQLRDVVLGNSKVGKALLAMGDLDPESSEAEWKKAQGSLARAVDIDYANLPPELRKKLAGLSQYQTGPDRQKRRSQLGDLATGAANLAAEQRQAVSGAVFAQADALRERRSFLGGNTAEAMMTREAAGGDWSSIDREIGELASATDNFAAALKSGGDLTAVGKDYRKEVSDLVDLSMGLPEKRRAEVARGVGGQAGAIMLEGARVGKALKGRGGVSTLKRLLSPFQGAAQFFSKERSREIKEYGLTTAQLDMMVKMVDPENMLGEEGRDKLAQGLADASAGKISETTRKDLGHALAGVTASGGARVKGTAGGGSGTSGSAVLEKFVERLGALLPKLEGVIAKAAAAGNKTPTGTK